MSDLNFFLGSTAYTLLGFLFHKRLHEDMKTNPHLAPFFAFPGGLFFLGPVGMVLAGIRILYP